jgi:hypothetical protein
MRTSFHLCSAIAVLALFSLAQAQGDSGASNSGRIVLPDGLTLKPHAYAHLEAGQMVSGNLNYQEASYFNNSKYAIDHVWTEDADIEFGFTSTYRERLKMEVSLGAKQAFSYPNYFDNGHTNTKYMNSYIYFDEAYGQYHFGQAESPWLMAQIGYFRFKYNPDVRNLGEYMFRTGTYPIYFDMSFDAPFQRLLGIHLQDNFFDNSLKLDWLLTSATTFPTMNWSFAALLDYDIAALHFVNFGAGVDFADLLDVYTDHAFPPDGGDPTQPKKGNFQYVAANGDTSWYSYQGTKIMARLSIDPKAFFKSRFLGSEDLKLYAEADLIGVQNYPDSGISPGIGKELVAPSYDNWKERIPIAIGFNVPTFRTLDVLNAEVEWFGAQYYNDATEVFVLQNNPPLPNVSGWGLPDAPRKTDIKWSIYAKKSFFNGHFVVTGQVARDHLRLSNAAFDFAQLWNEMLVTSNDWWWVLKTSWMF